jgi:hypothetical protein
VLPSLNDGRYRGLVTVIEKYADGLASFQDLRTARRNLPPWVAGAPNADSALVFPTAGGGDAMGTADAAWVARLARSQKADAAEQCALLRDVFGNPFRPATIDPGWLAWNGGTVPKLAEAIYDGRAFDRLPVLADALEDAGCADEQILSHCRGPGPHVRGCWVIDLLLGKG